MEEDNHIKFPSPQHVSLISTHSPIWPGCSKGAMPRGPARRPTREFLSGQFVAEIQHFSSPPVLRSPGTLCESGPIDFPP